MSPARVLLPSSLLFLAGLVHFAGWCISYFGTRKIGAPFLLLWCYPAEEYQLVFIGFGCCLAPSLIFCIVAKPGFHHSAFAWVVLAALGISVSGWIRLAAVSEVTIWTACSWIPYWIAVTGISASLLQRRTSRDNGGTEKDRHNPSSFVLRQKRTGRKGQA